VPADVREIREHLLEEKASRVRSGRARELHVGLEFITSRPLARRTYRTPGGRSSGRILAGV